MNDNIVLHGLDDRLDDILKDTYYQLIYQEQVTAIAVQLAGWSEGEADSIRKTIGRKIQKELDALIPRLIHDFIKNGMKEESAKTLASAIQACGSYSFNKCLAGSEKIMRLSNINPFTIEEMYKICHDKDYAVKYGHRSLRFKYSRHEYGVGYSLCEDDTFIANPIYNIEFAGIREVYKVTLENGSSVRCTINHRFPSNKGEVPLSELNVGDSLYIIKKYPQLNYSFMVGEGINLQKGNQIGFQKKEYAVSRLYGEYRNKCKEDKKPCELCGKEYGACRFELHHKDFNRGNSNASNLQWLCVSCHKKEHYRIGRRTVGLARRYFELCKIVSIEQDGVENTYSVEMYNDPHNFTLSSGIVSCNSHSYEYGLIAYQTAYLKANYPVQYMCSLLNANMDNTDDVIKYIDECKKMGIKVLPPSVKSGNTKFIPENGAIRFGLSCIKGINNIEIKQANNIYMFLINNHYNKRIKEALIKSGALDCFGTERSKLFSLAFDIENEIKLEQAKLKKCYDKISEKQYELEHSKEGTKKVATLKNQIENQKKAVQKSEDRIYELQHCYDDYNEEQGEIEVLGFTFKDKFSQYDAEKYHVYNPDMYINQRILADIIDVKLHKDKRGKQMAFISATPYLGSKTDFVMFASSFREQYAYLKGVYVLEVSKGNQVVGISSPDKIK